MNKSNFIVRGGADFSGITKAINKTQTQFQGFQGTLSKSMGKIGMILSALAVGSFIKDSTKMAMGFESATDNINRNMEASAKAFKTWVDTQSRVLGMGKAEAYKYGSTFSNLLGSFITDTRQTAEETQKLMKAAAIISSKTGRAYDDVSERIRSGMLGSTEAIEDLGVYTQVSMLESTNAFKKFANGKTWNQLNFQVQQQIRLAAILEQTYARYGDTLADTTQTRQAQFLASLKNIQLNLGKAFLAIYNTILPALTALANKIEEVTNTFSAFIENIFGIARVSPETEEQTDAVTDLGDATEKAGKKAKKALASFDQLNTIGDPSGGASAIISKKTAAATVNEVDKVNKSLDAMKARLKEIYENYGAKQLVVKVSIGLEYLKASITSAANALKNAFTPVFVQIKATLGSSTAQLQNIGQNMGNIIGESMRISLSNFGDIADTIAKAYEGFVKGNKANVQNFIDTVLKNLITTADNVSSAMSTLTDKIGKLRDEFWQTSKTDIVKILQNIMNATYKLTTPFIEGLTIGWKNASEQMKKFIETPGVQAYLNGLKDVLSNFIIPALKTLADRFSDIADIINPILTPGLMKLGDAFSYCFGAWLERVAKVLGFFGSLASKLSEIGNFFVTMPSKFDGFKTSISNFASSASDSFSKLAQSMLTGFKTPLESIRSLLNKFIGLWNGIKFELPKITMPDVLGGGTIGGGKFVVPQINQIPALADGGITNGKMLAMVGDNVGGREVISPLDDLKGMIAEVVSNAVKSSNTDTSGPINLVLKIGDTEFGNIVINSIKSAQRQAGVTLLEY